MNNKVMRFFIVAMLVPLAACEHQVWTKPGSSTADYGRDNYACTQAALKSAPPLIANVTLWDQGGGEKSGKNAAYSNGGGQVQPVDMNEDNRQQLINSCLNAKGWQLVTVKDQ